MFSVCLTDRNTGSANPFCDGVHMPRGKVQFQYVANGAGYLLPSNRNVGRSLWNSNSSLLHSSKPIFPGCFSQAARLCCRLTVDILKVSHSCFILQFIDPGFQEWFPGWHQRWAFSQRQTSIREEYYSRSSRLPTIPVQYPVYLITIFSTPHNSAIILSV